MTTLPDMAGTPRTVEIRGKEYKVSPLDINDLAEFDTVVMKQRNKALLESLKDAELDNKVIAEAIGATAAKPVSLSEINENMGSMTGVRFLLWCVLRKNQPNLKLEDMGNIVNLDNFGDAQEIVMDLGGKATKERKNARRAIKK